jgi:inner membrane protein
MNLPGHTGLTLGAFLAAGYLGDALLFHSYRMQSSRRRWISPLSSFFSSPPRVFQRLCLDYRAVLAGSLLPDVIDKPLGLFLLPQLLDFNGRTIGHTLAFNLVLLAVGLIIVKYRSYHAPLVLAIGSTGHLLLDQMWETPQTLLWPLLSWGFPPGVSDLNDWIMFQLTAQWLSVPEVIGLLVLIWFAIQIHRLRAIPRFVKTGSIE